MPIQLKWLKKIRSSTRLHTLEEEITNSITHGIGTGLSLAGLIVLVVLAVLYGNVYQTIGFTVYGVTLVTLYLASTLYHGIQHPRIKSIFMTIDYAAIYLLIAGTYTPFLLLAVGGMWGWTLLVIIWGLALLGASFKIFFTHRSETISVLTYLLMGWLSLLIIDDLVTNLPLSAVIWIAIGGVVYTVGVVFYLWQQIPYTHAIWHVFVLGGSICHYFVILLYLAPIS